MSRTLYRVSSLIVVFCCAILFVACSNGGFVPRCLSPGDCPNGRACLPDGACQTNPAENAKPDASSPTEKPTPEPVVPDTKETTVPDTKEPVTPEKAPTERPIEQKPDTSEQISPLCGMLQYMTPLGVATGSKLTFSVHGKDFPQDSKIVFDGKELTTKWINATKVETTLDLKGEITREVLVFLRCSAGKTIAKGFIIAPPGPGPQLDGMSPAVLGLSQIQPTFTLSLKTKFLPTGGRTYVRFIPRNAPTKWFDIGGSDVKIVHPALVEVTLRQKSGFALGEYDVMIMDRYKRFTNTQKLTVVSAHCVNKTQEVFKQNSGKVDILLVIDSSASMGDEQYELAKNANVLLNSLNQNKVDYQIGVTTVDVDGVQGTPGCLFGTTKIVTSSTPNALSTLQTNIKVGTGGSALEKGLESIKQTLSPAMLNNPNCNKGFLRQDADLMILIVTDEMDQSPSTVQTYINDLKALKASPYQVKVLGLLGGRNICRAFPYPRYQAVIKAFSGKEIAYCNIADDLAYRELLGMIPGLRDAFALKHKATPSSVTVKVNGVATTQWRLTHTDVTTVTFGSTAVPPAGGIVDISYTPVNPVSDTITKTGEKIDYLFVVDNSGSMLNNHQKLASEATNFINRLHTHGIDFQIGVTTTSVGGTPPGGCLGGQTKLATSKTTAAYAANVLKNNLQVGSVGKPNEQGLEAAKLGLSATRLNDPNCNKGLLRKDAKLMIVFISDEEDQSLSKVSDYIAAYTAVKGDAGLINVSLIGGTRNVSCSGSILGGRYIDVVNAFGGAVGSLCTIPKAMMDIADYPFRQPFTMALSLPADTSKAISVSVGGNPLVSGWKYEPLNNSIVFSVAPATGVEVKVDYHYKTCP
ncbi:MAG: hypothetical protein CL920_03000 [Deltaproteobacteria bacterium]|nr:hypothetical protein [Deltaproteobacteria bacterium]MBU47648.1 hypothetical protein [Deltaproteobacteria bacterium]